MINKEKINTGDHILLKGHTYWLTVTLKNENEFYAIDPFGIEFIHIPYGEIEKHKGYKR